MVPFYKILEVENVKDYAFYNCKGVTIIDIVDNVKSIGNSAFYGCSDLETLYISNTIESIDDYAFAGCENIKEIKIGLERPIRGAADTFADAVYDNAILYIPTGTKSLYEKREPWNIFFDIVEMDFTGIDEVKAENGQVEGIYYDLNGRAIKNPTKDIYIINGKKVWVK